MRGFKKSGGGKKQKGFIGPIGDDLPSLIPIIFSLVVFFTAFTATFSVFDKGNTRFDRTIKILKISDQMRGDKYINDIGEFKSLCDTVSVSGVNFKAGLVDLNQEGQPFERIDLQAFVDENAGIYKAKNTATGEDESLACPGKFEHMKPNSEAIVKMFPVAYQETDSNPVISARKIVSGFAVRPMLLVVVVWF
ncbi:MAG: hypothetical protein V1493_00505 [Candidatus Diapherotrites archaeon]